MFAVVEITNLRLVFSLPHWKDVAHRSVMIVFTRKKKDFENNKTVTFLAEAQPVVVLFKS